MGTRSSLAVIMMTSLALLLSLPGCESADPLPEKRPAGATMNFGFSPGMTPTGFQLSLSESGCTYEEQHGAGTACTSSFTLASADLDEVWRILRDNHIEDVKTDPGLVYDKGGYSVQVSWGTGNGARTINASESGADISQGSLPSWQKITKALETFKDRIVESRRVTLAVAVDESLDGRRFNLNVDETLLVGGLGDTTVPYQARLEVRVLPGPHRISLQVLHKGLPEDRIYLRPTTDFSSADQKIEVPATKEVAVAIDDRDAVAITPR